MKKQNGFTLIELMIVVAVIGVLSAIAIPQYQKYVTKSEATTALASISALKTEVELIVAETGTFPEDNLSVTSSSLGTISYDNKNKNKGDIIFTLNKNDKKKVKLSRDANGAWTCQSQFSTVSASLPSGCAVYSS